MIGDIRTSYALFLNSIVIGLPAQAAIPYPSSFQSIQVPQVIKVPYRVFLRLEIPSFIIIKKGVYDIYGTERTFRKSLTIEFEDLRKMDGIVCIINQNAFFRIFQKSAFLTG